MMDVHFQTIAAETTLDQFAAQTMPDREVMATYIVERSGEVVGFLTGEAALAAAGRSAAGSTALGDVASRAYVTVPEDARLLEIIAQMRDREALVALVAPQREDTAAAQVEGLITQERLTDFMAEAADWFED
jgi:CBS domain-containing protein